MPSLKALMAVKDADQDETTTSAKVAAAGVVRLNLPTAFNKPTHVEGHPD